MSEHERNCIAKKVTTPVEWVFRNAVGTSASETWLTGIDAVIVGGSGDFSVHDPRSRVWLDPLLQLIGATIRNDIPFFGICFGHQALATYFGSVVKSLPASAEIGTCQYDLTAEGATDPLFGRLPRRFQAQAGHSDSVMSTPAGMFLMVRNTTLETQAFRVQGKLAYSVQFHPDLTGAEARERYLAYKDELLSSGQDEPDKGAQQFILGSDAAGVLLDQFVKLAREHPTS